jgi:ribosomal protein S18 acetylase RimI-like enzyme
VLTFRTFRNDDPPRLVEVWNDAFLGRGSVKLKHSSPLDNYLLSKPYFDRQGLILAVEDDACVGFAHAGFGANAERTGAGREDGVLCLLGVRNSHRRRGIGTELLRRCEAYLGEGGARSLYAGPQPPHDPFYFGLYGGSSLPGFLTSDAAAEPFFRRHGYEPNSTFLVFQRQLVKPVTTADGRFATLRNRYETVVSAQQGIKSRWEECVLGPIELIEFRLEEKESGKVAARTRLWEMEGFSWRWNLPSVGIYDLEVREDLRRQGLAKYLVSQILRYLQEQFFGLVEVHFPQSHAPALGLFRGLGFEEVDRGQSFRKTAVTP